MSDTDQTKKPSPEFDFSAFPSDSVFHDRRTRVERRDRPNPDEPQAAKEAKEAKMPVERRAKKERRKRIDPTTFEKQYTEDEFEFMTAMQRFKEHSGKPFPTYGEVIRVAVSLGYRKVLIDDQTFGSLPSGEPAS